jgi:hypothetical protein
MGELETEKLVPHKAKVFPESNRKRAVEISIC